MPLYSVISNDLYMSSLFVIWAPMEEASDIVCEDALWDQTYLKAPNGLSLSHPQIPDLQYLWLHDALRAFLDKGYRLLFILSSPVVNHIHLIWKCETFGIAESWVAWAIDLFK